MTREQKIAQLLKIAPGQQARKRSCPGVVVHYISAPNSGQQNSLYVNDVLSYDPQDIKAFHREFAARRVKVIRK